MLYGIIVIDRQMNVYVYQEMLVEAVRMIQFHRFYELERLHQEDHRYQLNLGNPMVNEI